MFCMKCGQQLPDSACFCSSCGGHTDRAKADSFSRSQPTYRDLKDILADRSPAPDFWNDLNINQRNELRRLWANVQQGTAEGEEFKQYLSYCEKLIYQPMLKQIERESSTLYDEFLRASRAGDRGAMERYAKLDVATARQWDEVMGLMGFLGMLYFEVQFTERDVVQVDVVREESFASETVESAMQIDRFSRKLRGLPPGKL